MDDRIAVQGFLILCGYWSLLLPLACLLLVRADTLTKANQMHCHRSTHRLHRGSDASDAAHTTCMSLHGSFRFNGADFFSERRIGAPCVIVRYIGIILPRRIWSRIKPAGAGRSGVAIKTDLRACSAEVYAVRREEHGEK